MMRIPILAAVGAPLVGTSWLLAQDPRPQAAPEPFPAGYLDHQALTTALERVAAAHPETVRVRSLARTGQGRDVWLATVGRHEKSDETPRPALLIVANLE